MARSRSRTRTQDSNTVTQEATQPTETSTERKGYMPEVLDAATIQALLAKQKTRGEYDEELADFIQSGVAGVEISLIEGRFAGKKASNVKTGFDNARTRTNKQTNQPVHAGGNMVSVIKVGDAEKGEEEHVYLINKAVSADEADES